MGDDKDILINELRQEIEDLKYILKVLYKYFEHKPPKTYLKKVDLNYYLNDK